MNEEYNAYDSPDYALNGYNGSHKKPIKPVTPTLTSRFANYNDSDEKQPSFDDDPNKPDYHPKPGFIYPDSIGPEQDDEFIQKEEKSSTERVRKYYKRHPEKVRKYLKDTVKDRVARNRDRAKAVKKHGKSKMKNHDVHHPKGPNGGSWKLAKKDHGRDKVNEIFELVVESTNLHNIYQFVEYTVRRLNLRSMPKIVVLEPTAGMTSLGSYDVLTNTISVIARGRLLADILRTIAHEMAHQKQNEMGYITNPEIDGATGSRIENSANIIAGILLRDYGKLDRNIYLSENTIQCRACGWKWAAEKGGKHPFMCHKCWNQTGKYLMEGGAHGHLAHPFEDTDLSFQDFDEMLNRSLVGNLEKEGPVVEKMDGQNIAFTIRDGKVVFARNKGHLKNRAEKALSVEELSAMFAGRGEISDAFTKAAEDIQEAMSKLSPEQIEQVFGNGRSVMSTEIIYPGTRNVIPYDKTVLVFHGTLEHDDDGEKVGVQNTQNGKVISDAVTKVNADKQRTFGISGPRTVAISDKVTEETQQAYDTLSAKLEDIRSQYNLKPTDTLQDYLKEWWNEQLNTIESEQGFKFTGAERAGLVSRWVDSDKKFGVKNLSDEKKEWFREFEKTSLKPLLKQSVRPMEQVFLSAGVYALKRVVEFLSANNPVMAEELKKEFADSIRGIQQAGGPEKLQKLEYELARLKELGIDNVVPSEGLIFTYNGNPYKLTGAFAPVNQIIGTMKYNRAPEKVEEPKPSETPKDIKSVTDKLEFTPVTKKALPYKPHGEIADSSALEGMEPMTFATATSEMKVVTITADGKETENTAVPGDIIMSGPSGEKYVVKSAKFEKLYTKQEDGTVIPEQSPRQVARYDGTDEVTFTAPWGEQMVLKPGDYLVKDGDGFYRIAKKEYEITYNLPDAPKKSEEPPQPETPTEPAKPIAIYPGRFQPYHAGHQVTYNALVEKFGKENVYIATSDKQDSVTSPFSFKEKQEIMMAMFGIPEDRIVQTKNPYSPVEITQNFPENTPVVFAVGEKDAERLGGKYFQKYDPNEKMTGFRTAGYIWIGPPPNLEVNGKEISGSQLRSVMGDPNITDRAKQEIFTKVYGKFDKKIFDKVVKKASDAEEARKLTDMHGKAKKSGKKAAPDAGTKQGKKKPDAEALGRAKSVLGQKVRNPKTNRDILVATALKYPEDEPVRKAAEKIVQAAMNANESILTENTKSDKLKVYVSIREYTDEDLDDEADEYFKNERTLEAFPNIADSSAELKDMITKAPSEVLTRDELNNLTNSDVPDVLSGKNKMQILKNLLGRKQDVTGLLKDIKAQKPIAMPIVIKHIDGYYLLGGNTRLSVLAAIGHTMPVKVLGHGNPYPSPFIQGTSGNEKKGKQKKSGNKDLFKKLMQMRIVNPETGNQVKVDTAMDYSKEHPAHTAAMAFIRQHMKGISNRAGIPKNRND
jgi:hypothetical protein